MTTRPLLLGTDKVPAGFDDWTQKTAGSRLSGDARLWQGEIVAQLAAAHPFLPADQVTIEFNRIDPVKGAAVGTAKVGETGVTIPVIVKRARAGGDPELAPTDIFYAEGRYLPLTPQAVQSAMQSREIGEPVGGGSITGNPNPRVGHMTGDQSPLEMVPQQTQKSAAAKDVAKGGVMGAIAGMGYRAHGTMRDMEREANEGKKLTLKEKAKRMAKAVGSGAAVGGAVGAGATAAGGAMGLESPWVKKKASAAQPTVRELCEKGAFPDLDKIASSSEFIVEKLVKTSAMHPNDLANFRALLASSPQVLQGASATNLKLVDLILKHKGPGAKVPHTKVTRPNVLVIARDPITFDTVIKFTGGPVERLPFGAAGEKTLKTLLGPRYNEAMSAIKAHGMYTIAQDIQEVTWDVRRLDASDAKPVERDGLYSIRDRAGSVVSGLVIMQMFRPNGQSIPMRLFVSHDGRYATSPELFGVRLSGRNRLPSVKPKKGDFGVFVSYINGTPMSTTPMNIESVSSLTSDTADGVKTSDFVVFNVRDPMNGEQMALVPSRSVQGFARVREIDPTKMSLTRGDIYLMPADVEFVKLTGRVDVAKAADQVMKVAMSTTDVRYLGGEQFEVVEPERRNGNEVRLANTYYGSAMDVAELLTGMGMTKSEDVASILKQAQYDRNETISITGLHEPQLVRESIEVEDDKSFPIMERLLEGLRPTPTMLKAAAMAGDQALDVMLGLNFITPQNIRLFTDSIEQFDEVASKLASLLLASRLGLEHVHEDSIKEAMEGVARTSEHLRLLQSAAQFQRQQAQTS